MKLMGIQIGTENSKKLADFYKEVFGEPGWDENDWFGWVIEGGALMIGPHSEVKGQNDSPGRIMISLVDADVDAAFEKFLKAGAKEIAKPYQPNSENNPKVWLATVSDPDGNYIQIATPWE